MFDITILSGLSSYFVRMFHSIAFALFVPCTMFGNILNSFPRCHNKAKSSLFLPEYRSSSQFSHL